jgi:phospholipid-binding lipoprotein MlaA
MKAQMRKSILKTLAAMLAIAILSSCAAKQVKQEPAPLRPTSEYVDRDRDYVVKRVYDPWEGYNRGMYKFNAKFDKYVFLPVVNTYRVILPPFARDGVSNFFDNVGELDNLTNSILQLKAKKTGITAGRIVMNTIFGIGGLIDVATPIGLERQNEDFGQTLGHYGVGEGPFFVIPILGPSNIRDTGGLAFDAAVFTAIDPFNFDHNEELAWLYRGLGAVDARHQNEFRYYRSGSPFEYDMIRLFYTKGRKLLVDD